jgi:hypothetical protein
MNDLNHCKARSIYQALTGLHRARPRCCPVTELPRWSPHEAQLASH